MIRDDVYVTISDTFGTSIGVAHILGYKKRSEAKEEHPTQQSYKRFNEELDINEIITSAIEDGKYQRLQREVWRLKVKSGRKIKEITIYKKAWREIKND
jgi:hypothetical protein